MMDSERDPKEHLAGGRPWQWVFKSLRAAVEPASLVPSLLRFSTPTILQCCCHVPPLEVAADVALLVQAVSEKYLPVDGAEAACICQLTCIFVRGVFQRLQLEFTTDAVFTLVHFLQATITSASTVIVLGEEGQIEASRAKVEAVATLGHFLVQIHKGALLCKEDVARHVLFLVGLITYPAVPVPTTSVGSNNIYTDEVEVQRLTFVALGSLISQARPLVSDRTCTIVIQGHSYAITTLNGIFSAQGELMSFTTIHSKALRVVLESLASKKTVVEDFVAARYYVDLLRCVYIIVSEPEWCLKGHVRFSHLQVGAFVKVLRMFFCYGLGRTSTCSSTCQDERDSRTTWDLNGDGGNDLLLMSDNAEIITSTFSFDTDENVSGFSGEDVFRDRSSEVRLYSINAIQAMARLDPEGVKKSCSVVLAADNIIMQPW